jgi:hypothetical protein
MVKIKAAATDEITARTIIALDSHNILLDGILAVKILTATKEFFRCFTCI